MILLETFDEVMQFAPPRYLVRPLLEIGTTAMMFGASGAGKTFVALDLALSIAGGVDWAGMPTKSAPVVYVSAEGGRAFGRRVKAWYLTRLGQLESAHERQAMTEGVQRNFRIVRGALQVADGSVRGELVHAIRAQFDHSRTIGLVVLDTLARCAIDLDENAAQDMTRFVDSMVDLKVQLRSTGWLPHADAPNDDDAHEPAMLVVHHTGKQPFSEATGRTVERGSSALRAALDVVLGLEPGTPVRLSVEKMKDGEELAAMAVHWDDGEVVGLDEEAGVAITGRAARVSPPGSVQSAAGVKEQQLLERIKGQEFAIMELLERSPTISLREVAAELDHLLLTKSSVSRRIQALMAAGKVQKKGGCYKVLVHLQTLQGANLLDGIQ